MIRGKDKEKIVTILIRIIITAGRPMARLEHGGVDLARGVMHSATHLPTTNTIHHTNLHFIYYY